uniref:Uncharacterized protein n=1 Tax=Chaetoceros debilis TaxID=122233 RepID=A0A7S3V6M3_9STRA
MSRIKLENQDDDLYGDLEDNITPPTPSPSLSSEIRVNDKVKVPPGPRARQINIQHEREEIQILKQQVESLKKENNALKKNMGILYRSAKLELDRKDARTKRLEEELKMRA